MHEQESDPSRALRERAERLLAGRGGAGMENLPREVEALLHDLSVHQVELELQNEELRGAQQLIGRTRDDYARLYNQAPVGYLTLDGSGVILQANETLGAMLGTGTPALVGAGFADFLLEPDREVFRARYKAFFKSPRQKSIDARVRQAQGQPLRVRLTGRRDLEPASLSSPEAEGPLLVVVHDVTETDRAREALSAEKELLSVTLRSIGDGVISTDVRGRVTLMNRVAEALCGWRLEEAAGRPLAEVFRILHEGTREPCPNPADQVLASGQIVGLQNDTVLLSRDGTERIVADSGAPIRDRDNRMVGVVLAFRDATEETRMHRELQRMARLDSLGTLAGGIAHEFNNLLTAIVGNLGLVQASLREGTTDELPSLFADAERASARARDLTRQLIAFSKGGTPVRETISLGLLVREAVALAAKGTRSRVRVEEPPALWQVHADPAQLAQACRSLLLRADQSMPEGGQITCSLANVRVEPPASELLQAGVYVQLRVTDQGGAIDAETREKIFDPFFAATPSQGGLGLASAYAIVRNHGGIIRVESTPGKGSTFSVFLPALPDQRQSRPDLTALPGVQQPWRILVLDDEAMVAKVAERILSRAGHSVTTAPDGPEAIARWTAAREEGRPFDLLLLDLTIPGGIGGKEVLSHLRVLDPKVRAIASSGYSTDPVLANFRDYGFEARLPKPYAGVDLRALVSRLQTSK
jgi:PAS domain S-box-containing protein